MVHKIQNVLRFSSAKAEFVAGQGQEELEAVRGVFLDLEPSSASCSSQADVVMACILNTPDPAQSFVRCLDPLILKVCTQLYRTLLEFKDLTGQILPPIIVDPKSC